MSYNNYFSFPVSNWYALCHWNRWWVEVFSLPLCLLEWVDGAIQSSASGQPVKCALLCAAEKKEREQKGRGKKRNSVPLCVEDPAGKRFCNYFSLPAKQAWFLWSAHTCTLDCLTLFTVYTSTYKSERVFMGCVWTRFESQQQRRVSAPDDESRRQTSPWILMRR